MIKAIIFDFFGVIQADPYQIWLNKHGLKREGPYAEASDLVDMGKLSKLEFHKRLSELSGQPLEEVETAFYNHLETDDSLVELIKTLRGNYKIGLLSNSRGDYLRPILARHGISDLFDEVIISSEVGVIKPDVQIFKFALDKMDLETGAAIFVDDRSYNTEAAESIGLKSIVYRDLASLKEELSRLGVNTD